MSWNRILLPMKPEIEPDIKKIGEIAWDIFLREKKPAGFGMLHACTGNGDGTDDKFIVYLSPVASELCGEIAEKYPFEECRVPARDEPHIAWVFGDPMVKGYLRDSVDTDALVVT